MNSGRAVVPTERRIYLRFVVIEKIQINANTYRFIRIFVPGSRLYS